MQVMGTITPGGRLRMCPPPARPRVPYSDGLRVVAHDRHPWRNHGPSPQRRPRARRRECGRVALRPRWQHFSGGVSMALFLRSFVAIPDGRMVGDAPRGRARYIVAGAHHWARPHPPTISRGAGDVRFTQHCGAHSGSRGCLRVHSASFGFLRTAAFGLIHTGFDSFRVCSASFRPDADLPKPRSGDAPLSAYARATSFRPIQV